MIIYRIYFIACQTINSRNLTGSTKSAICQSIMFASAYNQLDQLEREFVDAFVGGLARAADKNYERIMSALSRFTRTVNLATLPEREAEMLRKPLVSAAIVEEVNRIAVEADMSPEWVLRRLKIIASSNMDDFTKRGEDGYLKPDFSRVTRDQMAAIKSFKFKEEYGRFGSRVHSEFTLHDPLAAMQTWARHTGLEKAENPVYAQYAAPAEIGHVTGDMTEAGAGDLYARYLGD